MNIKESAENYVSKETKCVSELEKVSIDLDMRTETRTDDKDKEFEVNLITIEEEDYRVPNSVLKQLKGILEDKATKNTKFFKVVKTGSGLKTSYQVLPLN